MSYSNAAIPKFICALSLAILCANSGYTLAAEVPAGEASVLVSRVSFSGNRTFTSEQLNAQIANEIGKPMTLLQMRALADKIQQLYHDAGYQLVKVIVPNQDFGNAESLRLVVLEGWLGDIEVTGNDRYSRERVIEALEAAGIHADKAFALEDVERALTRLNRQSGIEVSSTLKPGKEAGSTDMLIEVKEAPRVQGIVEVNNYGSEDTGENRLIPSLQLTNLTGRGDEMNLLGMTSVGDGDLHYEYIDYSTPINAIGTKVHAYYTQGNVDVGEEFQVLEIEGDNKGWGLGVSHDFVQSARTIYSLETWLESQDLEQKMLGTTTSEDKIRKLRVSFRLDDSGLNGRTLASVDLHQGLGEMLGGMDDDSEMSSRSGAHADNSFTKVSFDIARLQRITSRIMLIPRLYGQYSFDSLVSSEQWGIGGIGSVVGHESSTFSGDHGYTASLEGRYSLFGDNDRYQLAARIDHGQVFVKDPLIDQNDSDDLSGAAIGFLARPIDSLDFRIDYAVPVGERTDKSSYVYAQARYHF